jgi:hypothetical protein
LYHYFGNTFPTAANPVITVSALGAWQVEVTYNASAFASDPYRQQFLLTADPNSADGFKIGRILDYTKDGKIQLDTVWRNGEIIVYALNETGAAQELYHKPFTDVPSFAKIEPILRPLRDRQPVVKSLFEARLEGTNQLTVEERTFSDGSKKKFLVIKNQDGIQLSLEIQTWQKYLYNYGLYQYLSVTATAVDGRLFSVTSYLYSIPSYQRYNRTTYTLEKEVVPSGSFSRLEKTTSYQMIAGRFVKTAEYLMQPYQDVIYGRIYTINRTIQSTTWNYDSKGNAITEASYVSVYSAGGVLQKRISTTKYMTSSGLRYDLQIYERNRPVIYSYGLPALTVIRESSSGLIKSVQNSVMYK